MPKPAKRVIKPSGKKSTIVECPHCHQRVIPSKPDVCPSCLQPIEMKRGTIHPADVNRPSTAPVTLFTPRQVFYLSFLTGWPTGLVMASINWSRMGSAGTAVVHWVAGSILFGLWSFVLRDSSVSCGSWLGLIIHIGFCLYIYQQMKQSHKAFHLEGNQTRPAKWKSGCLAALATPILCFLLLVLLFLLFAAMSKSPGGL
jgi:hypothetical protein